MIKAKYKKRFKIEPMDDLKKKFEEEHLKLDYLVYSSHKTGTQSLVKTLKSSGFESLHCHCLNNIGLKSGGFRKYIEDYSLKNKKKLNVITVFREPIERHVSSFFQGHGTRPLQSKIVEDKSETIINRYTIEQLRKKFISELSAETLIGYRESIHELCKELQISTNELPPYRKKHRFSIYETENIRLYLIRFDDLIENFKSILSEITKTPLKIEFDNLSALKWYKDVYFQFKESLKIPNRIILKAYNAKRDIINLTYPDGFDSNLNQALMKYGNEQKSGSLLILNHVEKVIFRTKNIRNSIVLFGKMTLKRISSKRL